MLTLLAMALTKRSVTFFMETTSNVHMNQGSVAELHNWRDIDSILAENKKNKDSFIDIYNEHGDSFHETVYRCNLREKYIELFGKAMEEYNARQSRSDRKMTIDKYMKPFKDCDVSEITGTTKTANLAETVISDEKKGGGKLQIFQEHAPALTPAVLREVQGLAGDAEVPVLNQQGIFGGAKDVEQTGDDSGIVPAVMDKSVAPAVEDDRFVSPSVSNSGMVEHIVAPQKFDGSTGGIVPESASYKIEERPKALEPLNSKGLDDLDAYLYLEDRLSRGRSKIEQLQQIMSKSNAYPEPLKQGIFDTVNGYLRDMQFTLPDDDENFLQDLRFQGMEMDLKESGLSHYFPVIETENDELNQLLAKERRGNIERTFGKVFDVYNGTNSTQRQYFDNSYTKNLFLSPQQEFSPNVKNLLNDIEKQGVNEYLSNSLPSLIEQKKSAMKSFFQNGANKLSSLL